MKFFTIDNLVRLLIAMATCSTLLIVLSIFFNSDSSDLTTINSEAPQITTTTLPPIGSVEPAAGISNDRKFSTGPWWIVENLSAISIKNPTSDNMTYKFAVVVSQGVCKTPRTLVMTVDNRSTTHYLNNSRSESTRSVQVTVKSMDSSNLIIQVSGPACQAPLDSRILWAEIKLENIDIYPSADVFDFGSTNPGT